MKHNLNVIHINGLRGILLTAGIACCLFAGFVVFPGWLAMLGWNKAASYFAQIPSIGIIQGVILWCIVVFSYMIFKKDRIIVCVKSPNGLTEEELKAVFADIKENAKEDAILKSMLQARKAELELKEKQCGENNEDKISDKEQI